MREIKFRAWDGDAMQYDIGIANNYAFDYDHESAWPWHEPAKAIMQYTGLKDKNGKPIYEGDILKFKSRKVSTVIDGVRQDVIRENLGVVYFDTGKAGGPSAEFNCTEVGGNDQPSWWMCSLKEVIGNIYENPELLEGACQ